MGKKIACPSLKNMYTLDTNVIIYYLKNDAAAVLILNSFFVKNITLYVATITEVELFSFSTLGSEEIERIENILNTVVIIPLESRLARIAGLLRREYKLKIADSVIAATALMANSTLLTRNLRDFKNIPHLRLQPV